ncbi:DUF4352 domain-containing protein [Parabacteroides gordonii]|jgi:uncharacterized protein affecting Mg2+/Co2+ transport|uniref:DUF4352 domain-containing protein n=1 Tax=Parabacteroides gordonii MS-1 = DSM 23371 TaxID=1203610 RepID=A0A0F5JBM6_9BACT|nr:hypothetical protein [Parabacteroides gordonii]KKB55159.1 hypothetical protein HMPREF1536_02616 [Parabacteroides gordonii MS-1 = DSM 23371]MCA5582038.1 DUF4352 domain-containing protein [Parabacteroides gordonii]
MKTNTKILAILLFISVLGNILLVINPENASKVHNLAQIENISKGESKKVFEIKLLDTKITGNDRENVSYETWTIKVSNVSNEEQTFLTRDFVLIDQDGRKFSPMEVRGAEGFNINPGLETEYAIMFMTPSDVLESYLEDTTGKSKVL